MFKNKLKKAMGIKKEAVDISAQIAMYAVSQIVSSGDMVDYIVLLLARYKFISPIEVSYAKTKMTQALYENRVELESVMAKVINSYLSNDPKRYGYNYGNSGRKTDPADGGQQSNKNYEDSMDEDLSAGQISQDKQDPVSKGDKTKQNKGESSGSGDWGSSFFSSNLGS